MFGVKKLQEWVEIAMDRTHALSQDVRLLETKVDVIDSVQDSQLEVGRHYEERLGTLEGRLIEFNKGMTALAARAGRDDILLRDDVSQLKQGLGYQDGRLTHAMAKILDVRKALEDVERRQTEQNDILYGIIAHLGLRVTWHPEETDRERWTVEKANDQDLG